MFYEGREKGKRERYAKTTKKKSESRYSSCGKEKESLRVQGQKSSAW